jgi:hypothetical protein
MNCAGRPRAGTWQHVEPWASAEDYLKNHSMRRTSCLVLDAQLLGMNGFKLQRHVFEKVVAGFRSFFSLLRTMNGCKKRRLRL